MRAANNDSAMARESDFIASVNRVSCLFGNYISEEFERIGMRYSYRHIVKPLMENEKLTQLELVNITGLKAPTISITLRNMERDGIVKREKNISDRRETYVFITDKGKKMYAKVLSALDKAEKIMLKGLSEEELVAMCDTLNKMGENLKSENK